MIDQIKKELKNNPFLCDKEVTKDNCRMYYEFHLQYLNCKSCTGLNNCQNSNKGFKPKLSGDKMVYQKCELLKQTDLSNVKSLYLSAQSLIANLDDFHTTTADRKKCLKWATNFVTNFHNETKGLYLYGRFGTGKTYLLSAIAKELSQRNIKTIVAFFPDLSRELKSSINSNNLETFVNELKTIDCLMLDDFGGEMSSAWLRDEIMTPIFQYRLAEGKPTFISSNLDYSELVNHLATSKMGTDQLKAGRILERIKSLTVLVNLDEKVQK
ncbi:MAG: DnaA/Hda family protein [bacterium]